ncbi:hypothetical protein P3T76_001537 [Phytophthora citrophthora]|uniref:RxLR effector protein n=1 Tax=Phytophthora citrophthora TaxID=4793 RepID=A0AAD9LUN8_9STRA|nr:hypothetical protein P3T76_001537 [Phytophthora citrophthora]
MRLSNVLLIMVAACLASVNVADKTGVSTISEHHDSLGNRHLRTARIANTIDTEERAIGEVNVDILIKDALTKSKMSVATATV